MKEKEKQNQEIDGDREEIDVEKTYKIGLLSELSAIRRQLEILNRNIDGLTQKQKHTQTQQNNQYRCGLCDEKDSDRDRLIDHIKKSHNANNELAERTIEKIDT